MRLRPGFFTLLLFALVFIFSYPAAAQQKEAPHAGSTPLNDLGTGLYLGLYQGGLYPGGSNTLPAAHAAEGLARANAVQPLDTSGNPDSEGKIVFLSIGMSNAMMEFCNATRLEKPCSPGSFSHRAANAAGLNRSTLFIVNGAKGSQVANTWDDPSEANYDEIRNQMLAPQGLSEDQVQVVWMKMGNVNPNTSLPENAADARIMLYHYGNILRALNIRYPNLQQVFVSSRIYAGYATGPLNPEPYAYEYGFATKWLIEAQIDQAAGGAADPIAGNLDYNTVAPWVAWGPYLWADGLNPRSDGLTWEIDDFMADGVHPSLNGGIPKVGGLMMDFFNGDPLASPWFLETDGQPGEIRGNVQLSGRTNHSGATVRALLWNSEVVSATTTTGGDYVLPVVPAAGLRVTVEAPGYLRAEHFGVDVGDGESVTVPGVLLLAGDANDDDTVDILDLALIGGAYGLSCGDPAWNPAADFNQDCTVNILDLTMAAANYEVAGPVIWP